VPVTGGSFDGPEWGTQPYTNMFAADTGSVDPSYPVPTLLGAFAKQHGGTVLATYGYGGAVTSVRGANATAISMQHAGGKVGVLNTSVPIASVNFTSDAIIAKQNNVNVLIGQMGNQSNFALATAFQQEGVKTKVVVFPTGYEQDVIGTPVWKSLQDGYFESFFRPFSLPNQGTQEMAAALERYSHFGKTQFPNYGQYEAWIGTDLFVQGLGRAGKDPSRASVIESLRSIKSYDAGGLLPVSINYATIFGHNTPQYCAWFLRARTTGFVPISPQAQCGTYIPNTNTASPSPS
jgi:branched-chain amino acid transport system substrate-binding protein